MRVPQFLSRANIPINPASSTPGRGALTNRLDLGGTAVIQSSPPSPAPQTSLLPAPLSQDCHRQLQPYRASADNGGAVEPRVHTPDRVHSACVGEIDVTDNAVIEHERAHARPLAVVCGHVGPAHGGKVLLCSFARRFVRAPLKSAGPCCATPSVDCAAAQAVTGHNR